MISTAIRSAAPRNWASHHGFQAVAGSCDRSEAVKRYTTRKAKAAAAEAEEEGRPPPLVCADCRTSETPLWRSGPDGPKSLCNACGIKYRKRRRALAATQGRITAQPTSSPSAGSKNKVDEEMRTEELKRRQREKQEKMLKLLLFQHQEQKRSKREEQKAAEEAAREIEEAALLLLSLSSGLFAHS